MADVFVRKLYLKNYRSYPDLYLALDPGLNILVGANAAGKTNLLEAIYYLAAARSPRSPRDVELIHWGQEGFYIKALVTDGQVEHTLEFGFRSGRKKSIRMDGVPQERVSNIVGLINAVIFSPDDLSLIKGRPDIRRRFFDGEIGQVNPRFLSFHQRYYRILMQRNDVLKRLRRNRAVPEDALVQLQPWDEQLVQAGGELIVMRLDALRQWGALTQATYRELSGPEEELDLAYESSVGGSQALTSRSPSTEPPTVVDWQAAFKDALERARETELERGHTVIGPHRDDVRLTLNGHDLKEYGSQGQQRSAALAIKIAEVEWMRLETRRSPVLLLDDVMSELDISRSQRLAQLLDRGTQTILTCTDLADVDYDVLEGTLWRVRNGEVIPVAERK